MQNTKEGIVKFILSLKTGRDILIASLLLAIIWLAALCVYLFVINNGLHSKLENQAIKNTQLYIDFYTKQNDYILRLRDKWDSAQEESNINSIKK